MPSSYDLQCYYHRFSLCHLGLFKIPQICFFCVEFGAWDILFLILFFYRECQMWVMERHIWRRRTGHKSGRMHSREMGKDNSGWHSKRVCPQNIGEDTDIPSQHTALLHYNTGWHALAPLQHTTCWNRKSKKKPIMDAYLWTRTTFCIRLRSNRLVPSAEMTNS